MRTNRVTRSRRHFLANGVGVSAAGLLASGWLRAMTAEPEDRVARVLAECTGIDMHNHVYPSGTEPHPHFGSPPPGGAGKGGPGGPGGPPGGGPTPLGTAQQQGPELALAAELKQSGLAAVCASYVLDFAENTKPGDARRNLLRWFAAMDEQLRQGHLRRALTLADLQAAHAQRRPTIVQSVEGAQFIEGEIDRVEEFYRRGLRHLQLLHMTDDKVAPLGDVNTAPAKVGGLTEVGAKVVRECNRLGIVVDMAHADDKTLAGALKGATQPLLLSHTNIDTWTGKNARMAEMMKPRLISKQVAKTVADADGVVGVWTHLADSPEEYVGSIKAMVDAVGVDHVGLGSDTDLLSSRVGGGTNHAWPGMTQGFLPVVVGEMLHQGFAAGDIGKIAGGNYCRVFGKVTAGHG